MAKSSDNLAQLGFLIGRAYYSYIGMLERLLTEAGLAEHVKPGMGSLLFALFRRDNRTIGELAEELQLARSTMTGMVERMRRSGLILMARDAKDRRSIRLRLTPLARRLKPRCRKLADRVERLLCEGMTPADAELLRAALAAMIRTMNLQISTVPVSRSPARARARAKEVLS